MEEDEHTRTDRMYCWFVFILLQTASYDKGIINHSVFESTDWFQSYSKIFFAQAAMTEAVGLLWMIFQPFLFGLIGAAVRIEQIQDPYIVGKI